MGTVSQIAGAMLIIVAFADLYLTVLRGGRSSLLSARVDHGVWQIFRHVSAKLGPGKTRLLSYAGPTLIPLMVLIWVVLLSVGFALIFLPVVGTKVVAANGHPMTGFWPALYFSLMSLATLGSGDIIATNNLYRMLEVTAAVTGFSTVTAALTYLMSVYNSLIRHNSFALLLHHASGDTGDAIELVARFGAGGSFSASQASISGLASELTFIIEAHRIYTVLRYFRRAKPACGLPQIALLTLDGASLIRSALNQTHYRGLVRSTTTAQLWRGGLQLLTDLESSFLPKDLVKRHQPDADDEREWRVHYRRALERFQTEGIVTPCDPTAGEDYYIELRRSWQPHVAAFADYLMYDWHEVSPVERTGDERHLLADG